MKQNIPHEILKPSGYQFPTTFQSSPTPLILQPNDLMTSSFIGIIRERFILFISKLARGTTVKLTLTFLAALAIHIGQGRVKWAVSKGANQSLALHSTVLGEQKVLNWEFYLATAEMFSNTGTWKSIFKCNELSNNSQKRQFNVGLLITTRTETIPSECHTYNLLTWKMCSLRW